MDTLIKVLWAVGPSLMVSIIMAWHNRQQKVRDDNAAAREKERLKSEQLRIDLLVASAQLSYATTMAMKRGHTNGEVEPAVEQYEKAMGKFRQFEREQLAKTSTEI